MMLASQLLIVLTVAVHSHCHCCPLTLIMAQLSHASYRVFLGAPSKLDISNDPLDYQWQTITSRSEPSERPTSGPSLAAISTRERSYSAVILPPATLEAASQRISLIYKGLVFGNDWDDDEDGESLDFIESFLATQKNQVDGSMSWSAPAPDGDESRHSAAPRDAERNSLVEDEISRLAAASDRGGGFFFGQLFFK